MKRRGLLLIGAGFLLIVVMILVWAAIVSLVAAHTLHVPAAEAERLTFAFSMIIVCGALGVANGAWLAIKGRPNVALTITTVVLFVASIGVIWQAATSSPSA
jgi:FtsH-binding integral membrane protein